MVAEQNYALWQELRLANGVNHEQSAVPSLTVDIQAQLTALAAADQLLIDRISQVVQQLGEPTGFEGFAPIRKKKLLGHVSEMEQVLTWFADQRHLDVTEVERVAYNGLAGSLGNVRTNVAEHAQAARQLLVAGPKKLRRPGEDQSVAPPELNN